MFGVPIDGPADVSCDNNGVVKDTTIPESMLAKKHNVINYRSGGSKDPSSWKGGWDDESCRLVHKGVDG
jgi:hypothetical protein